MQLYRRELRHALLQPETGRSIVKMQRGKTKMTEQTKESRKVRENLTADEKQRLEKYGALELKSVGATRKR